MNTNFTPWQPSSWPKVPREYNDNFGKILKSIFIESLVLEIKNIISDMPKTKDGIPNIEHRGHVLVLSILCAIDTLSSYAFYNTDIERCSQCGRGDSISIRYQKYIDNFFPKEYKLFSKKIYKLYRNPITHSWNLFKATMLPGNDGIKEINGVVILGLLNFFNALEYSINSFIKKLKEDKNLQKSALLRYDELQSSVLQ